jgi:hypothetical protein
VSDPTADRITAALSESIRAGELGDVTAGMPAGWVLVGTYHDEDGDLRTFFLTNDGARQHETLGLLAMGQTVWQEEARRWVLGQRDDE